ncbi:MAG: flagellar hook-length control protein FliK [Bdellovibrionia bacterium]
MMEKLSSLSIDPSSSRSPSTAKALGERRPSLASLDRSRDKNRTAQKSRSQGDSEFMGYISQAQQTRQPIESSPAGESSVSSGRSPSPQAPGESSKAGGSNPVLKAGQKDSPNLLSSLEVLPEPESLDSLVGGSKIVFTKKGLSPWGETQDGVQAEDQTVKSTAMNAAGLVPAGKEEVLSDWEVFLPLKQPSIDPGSQPVSGREIQDGMTLSELAQNFQGQWQGDTESSLDAPSEAIVNRQSSRSQGKLMAVNSGASPMNPLEIREFMRSVQGANQQKGGGFQDQSSSFGAMIQEGPSGEKGVESMDAGGSEGKGPAPMMLNPRAEVLLGAQMGPALGFASADAGRSMISASVTTGANAQPRLTSESLQNLGLNIKQIAAQGSGSMRVHLRPDHLGELSIRVSTQGNQVQLQIQATDERAKKIIEESLGSLKDSLSSQNLSLKQVDLSVAQQQPSMSLNSEFNQDSGSPSFQSGFQESWSGGSERGFRDAQREEGLENPSARGGRTEGLRMFNPVRASALGSGLGRSGRIDLMG